MILIFGRLDDPPLSSAVDALQERGAEYVILEQSALDTEDVFLEASSSGIEGVLVAAGQEHLLSSVHSIYARPLELPSRLTDMARAQALQNHLLEWLDVSPALVVNRPRAMRSNASKPLQIQLIGDAGFLVPETLVTSDAAEARAFWREHGRVIYKSISGVRSIVQELDERAAERLARLSALPVQFQAFVPGIDVRVHVVGDRTFAAEISAAGIDYRYSSRQGGSVAMTAIELPQDVAARCVDVSRLMELPLSGIDLRRRPDGEYVCLEVNPMPAYVYFEGQTGLPIGEALAELLLNGVTASHEAIHATSDRESDLAGGNHRVAAAASAAAGL